MPTTNDISRLQTIDFTCFPRSGAEVVTDRQEQMKCELMMRSDEVLQKVEDGRRTGTTKEEQKREDHKSDREGRKRAELKSRGSRGLKPKTTS